jgi:hypothetical protein
VKTIFDSTVERRRCTLNTKDVVLIDANNDSAENFEETQKSLHYDYCIFLIDSTGGVTVTQSFRFDNLTAQKFCVTSLKFSTQKPQFFIENELFLRLFGNFLRDEPLGTFNKYRCDA